MELLDHEVVVKRQPPQGNANNAEEHHKGCRRCLVRLAPVRWKLIGTWRGRQREDRCRRRRSAFTCRCRHERQFIVGRMERGDFAVGSVPDRGITPGSLENAEAVYFRIVWTVYSESSDSCLQRITLTLVAW